MIITGDAREVLKTLPDQSVHCCVTSPPYWGLRDYGVDGQLGLEETPEEYVDNLVQVFCEVRRVLRDDGTLWLNLGDSYASGGKGGGGSFMHERRDGSWHHRSQVNGWRSPPPGLKPKDLVGIPWRVAFALQEDGWYLRSDIIWHKPNPMPESVTDRPTKAHEYIFLLAKSQRYYYDAEAIMEPAVRAGDTQTFGGGKGRNYRPEKGDPNYRAGSEQWGRTITTGDKRNKRTVWTVPTSPFSGAHFATFPEELIQPCILAGCPVGGTVLDPFFGSGTTGLVALKLDRRYIGIELNPEYVKLAKERLFPVESQARLALWQ